MPARELPFFLIVIGIVVAYLVDHSLGVVCILVGLLVLVWPSLRRMSR